MTKFEVTDAMLESAIAAWFAVVEGIDPRTCEGVPVPPENLHDAMRAAITAAFEASGLVERIAELEERLNHAHDTSRHFMGIHKNTAKYFLHISNILKPHVEDTTNDQ